MADAPLSRRARRALEEEAAAAAAARPVEGAQPPAEAPAVDPQNLSRRDRRRLERLNAPMETWTAEEEMIATGQIPVLTPERIAEQEKIAREKAERAAQDALLASQEFRVVTPGDLTPAHPARPEAFPEPQTPAWQPSANSEVQEPVAEPDAVAFEPPRAEVSPEPAEQTFAADAFAPPAQEPTAVPEPAPETFAPPVQPESSFWAPPAPEPVEPASNWRQQDLESTWTVTGPSNDANDDWDPFGEREASREQAPISEPAPPVWTPPASYAPAEVTEAEQVGEQEQVAEQEPVADTEAPAQPIDVSAAPEAYTPTFDLVDDEPQAAPEPEAPVVPLLGDAEPDVANDKEARARLFSDLFAGQGFSPEPVDEVEAGADAEAPVEPAPESVVEPESAVQSEPQTADQPEPVAEPAPDSQAAGVPDHGPSAELSGADEIRRLAEEAITGIERAAATPAETARPATWGDVPASAELPVGNEQDPQHQEADFGDTIAVAPRTQDTPPASLGDWSPADWAAQSSQPMPEQAARWGESSGSAQASAQQSPWAQVEPRGEDVRPEASAPAQEPRQEPAEEVDRFSWADAVAASSGDVPQVQRPEPAWDESPDPAASPAWDEQPAAPAWDEQPAPASAPESGETPWHPLDAVQAPTTDVNDFTPVTAAPKPDFSQLYQTGQFPPVSGGTTPASGQLPTAGQFPPPTGSQPTVAFPGVGTPAGGAAGYTTDVTATGSIRRIEVPTQPEAREFKWLHLGVIGALVFVLGVVIYNVTMNG